MKSVAILIYAEQHEDRIAEVNRQTALIPADEYSFELFIDPDLDKAWAAAGSRDFYIWLHGALQLRENAIFQLLDNSSFLSDRALIAGSVKDGSGRLVSGGFSWNRVILAPDPVIPVPCKIFDGLLALIPGCVHESVGLLGGRYRGQLAGFDYAARARHAGFPSVIAPGVPGLCDVRPNPERTIREDFMLDLRNKGLFQAAWYSLKSWFRRLVINHLT